MLDHGHLLFTIVAAAVVSWPISAIPQLIAVAAVFVPVCVVVIASWDGLGSATTALGRDYSPLLACLLMCWTAAHIPAALITLTAPAILAPSLFLPVIAAVRLAALAYFLILAVFAVRTVTGASAAHAAGTVLGGAIAATLAIFAYGIFGGMLRYLASPFMLIWFFILFRPNLNLDFLSGGLRSRQNFRRHLEASTLNPRDSDAHYQLGLIYQQRRNYTEAIARFEKAVEIDPTEADPHYQLGRIAREQGRHEDALRHFEAAAAIDPKHASSEVLRDLGATHLELGHVEAARDQLEKYVERREYDAEGQYHLGQVYKRLHRTQEAHAAFENAVEAARTAPPHIRRHAARWLKLARAELR